MVDEYIKRGRIRDAGDVLRKMAEIDPSDLKVRSKLADLYARDGNPEKAVDEYVAIADELHQEGPPGRGPAGPREGPALEAAQPAAALGGGPGPPRPEELREGDRAPRGGAPRDPGRPRDLAPARRGLPRVQADRRGRARPRGAARSATPSDQDARLQMGQVYLAEGRFDEAFDQFLPVVDKLVERRQVDRAAALLQQIVQRNAAHIKSLAKLVEVYRLSRKDTLVAQTYSPDDRGLHATGGLDQAASILEILVQLEPHNEQHRTKLSWLREQKGGGRPAAPTSRSTFEQAPRRAGPRSPSRRPPTPGAAGRHRAVGPALGRRPGVHRRAPRRGPRLPQVRPRRQGRGPVRGGARALPGQPRGAAGARRHLQGEGRQRRRPASSCAPWPRSTG